MLKLVVSVIAFAYVCVLSLYAGDNHAETRSKALAHFIMAEIHDFSGNSAEAITEYERSSSLDRSQSLPRLRLASFYARAGLLTKAQEQLKSVVDQDPLNAQAHYLMALVYSSQKQYDLAAKEYEQILTGKLEDTPQNLDIHINLAQLYFSQKKFHKAVEEFQKIVKIDPENVSAYYLMGSAYLELHDNFNAKEQFRKVLRRDPDNDQVLNALAYVYAQLGENLDEALKMSQKAIDIDGNNGAYYDTLGWLLYKKGRHSESLLALQKAEMYIKDAELYDHMGDVYHAIKEFALARKYWRKSLEFNPKEYGVQDKINNLEKIQAFQEQ